MYGAGSGAGFGVAKPQSVHDTRPRFVAFAVYASLVKEHRCIRGQTSTNRGDDKSIEDFSATD
jgi:hypothetical protein